MNTFFWNPSPVAFYIPFIDHPVRWYGVFFALGFLVSYFIMAHIFKVQLEREGRKSGDIPHRLADSLLWYIVLATVIGARLGHVLFYDFSFYMEHPAEILKIWHGGLASHGATIGILIGVALFYFRNKEELPVKSFWGFLDLFVIPVPFAAGCIRLGNFFNQEIVGTQTALPWGVVFRNPAEAVSIVPRHPVQLYEAFTYFSLFILLVILWKVGKTRFLAGIFFVVAFLSRFLWEFLKVRQYDAPLPLGLDMGQWLSLPFVALGLYLLLKNKKK